VAAGAWAAAGAAAAVARMRLALAATLLIAACATADLSGAYEGAERDLRLTLWPEGRAAMTGAVAGSASRFWVEGTWQRDGRRVAIELRGPRPDRLVFEVGGDLLVAKEWDAVAWGEKGPGVLHRVR
jgi:hypothetical protein